MLRFTNTKNSFLGQNDVRAARTINQDGSLINPSFTFDDDRDTGILSLVDGSVSIAGDGKEILKMDSSGATLLVGAFTGDLLSSELLSPTNDLDILVTHGKDSKEEKLALISQEITMDGYVHGYINSLVLPTDLTVDSKHRTATKASSATSNIFVGDTDNFTAGPGQATQRVDIKITSASAANLFHLGMSSNPVFNYDEPPFQAVLSGYQLVPHNATYADIDDEEDLRGYYFPKFETDKSAAMYNDEDGIFIYQSNDRVIYHPLSTTTGGSQCRLQDEIALPTSDPVLFAMEATAFTNPNMVSGFKKHDSNIVSGVSMKQFGVGFGIGTAYYEAGVSVDPSGWGVVVGDLIIHIIDGQQVYATLYRPSTNTVVNSRSYDLTGYAFSKIVPSTFDSSTNSSSAIVSIIDPSSIISGATRVPQKIATFAAGDVFTLELTGNDLSLYKNSSLMPGIITLGNGAYYPFGGTFGIHTHDWAISLMAKTGMQTSNLTSDAKIRAENIECGNLRCEGVSGCSEFASNNSLIELKSEDVKFGTFREQKPLSSTNSLYGSTWDASYTGNSMIVNNIRDQIAHSSTSRQWVYSKDSVTIPTSKPTYVKIFTQSNVLQPALFMGVALGKTMTVNEDTCIGESDVYGVISDGISTPFSQAQWDDGPLLSAVHTNVGADVRTLQQAATVNRHGSLTGYNHTTASSGTRFGFKITLSALSAANFAIGFARSSTFLVDAVIEGQANTWFITSDGSIFDAGAANGSYGETFGANDTILVIVDGLTVRYIRERTNNTYVLLHTQTVPAQTDMRFMVGDNDALNSSWTITLKSWNAFIADGVLSTLSDHRGLNSSTSCECVLTVLILGNNLFYAASNEYGRYIPIGYEIGVPSGEYFALAGSPSNLTPQGYSARIEMSGGLTLESLEVKDGAIANSISVRNLILENNSPVKHLGVPLGALAVIPVISSLVNLAGAPSYDYHQHMRVGNRVTHNVSISGLSTAAAIPTSFVLSLPIPIEAPFGNNTIFGWAQLKDNGSGNIFSFACENNGTSLTTCKFVSKVSPGNWGLSDYIKLEVSYESYAEN